MKLNNLLFLLLFFVSGWTSFALAEGAVEVVAAKGEYSFGPDTSERDACSFAKRLMIDNAARGLNGEKTSSSEKINCSDELFRASGESCDISSTFSSYLDYETVDESIEKIEVLYPQNTKNYLCSVEGTVSLRLNEIRQDAFWSTTLDLEVEKLSDDTSSVSFSISSSIIGFHYVFHELNSGALELIFPNAFDRANQFKGTKKIPSSKSLRGYDIKIHNSEKSKNFYMLSTQQLIESLQGLEIKRITALQRDSIRRSLSKGSWVQIRS
jgi:hypothetical protein